MSGLSAELTPWLRPLALLGTWILAGLTAHLVLGRRIRRAEVSSSKADELLWRALQRYLPLWSALAGLAFALPLAPLVGREQAFVAQAVLAVAVLSGAWAASGLVLSLLAQHGPALGLSAASLGLSRTVMRGVFLGLGALVVLADLGVSVAPLLTALGVGSLAVALALQDTLSNLFAGIHIAASRQVRQGDYVRIDSGQEGYVADIGWRSTRIRQLAGNMVIVPNAKLSQAIITNFDSPQKDLAVLVDVGVSYGADLGSVERVTAEVAQGVMRDVPGGVPGFSPFIRYNRFGDSAVGFTVILRACEYADRFIVQHEFIKRLHSRYAEEGIEIPFPQRVVTLKQAIPPAEGGS